MGVAKVAIRLYRILRTNRGYPDFVRVESATRGCPLAVASEAVEFIGRPRPDANRDSDTRIVAEVEAVSMAGGTT